MKFQWLLLLLSSFSSIFFFSSPADAAKLLLWRFDANQNRLVFTTDGSVQPKAQLLADPTRLVIDLPGITLERPTLNQTGRGAIQEIRVGQLNDQTTRIVVELAPGYTIDPQQVKFQGISPSQWSVQLPTPQRLATLPRTTPSVIVDPSPNTSSSSNNPSSSNRVATIESVELTNNGTQLIIRADRGVRASSRWDGIAKGYQITIPSAKLADRVRGPQLDRSSSVSQILIRQQDSRTVTVLVKPSPGTQIGDLNQLSDRLLALQLQPAKSVLPPTGSIPVPPPNRPAPSTSFPGVPNSRIVVMLDPGHGGKDPGAIGIGGLREKDVILPISQQVARRLEQQGIQTVMTRSDDRFISLAGRVQMAKRTGADIFVSIHANAISMRRPDVNGLETYYFANPRLAQTIHNSIMQSVNIRDRGVRRARFYVLRNNSVPSVLVEVGFVTGAEDARQLASPAFQSQMADAIARGILQYIQQNF